jgi:ABC-type polysaccharide/polyol phosphate transport system ATPase subunit
MTLIDLQHVNLSVPIYNASSFSFRSFLTKISSNQRFTENKNSIEFSVLDDISLSLKEGDKMGLVGLNGAGKTTLLKAISGIYKPQSGSIKIDGKISCLLGTGFALEEDATGYENIFLSGLYLGFPKSFMKTKVEEIIAFSELDHFIYMPLRTYSAGMKARLFFAISTCYQPEILIVDEGIGAGDKNFLKKVKKRLQSFMDSASILILASHSEALIKTFCNKGIFLNKGKIAYQGEIDEVLDYYQKQT